MRDASSIRCHVEISPAKRMVFEDPQDSSIRHWTAPMHLHQETAPKPPSEREPWFGQFKRMSLFFQRSAPDIASKNDSIQLRHTVCCKSPAEFSSGSLGGTRMQRISAWCGLTLGGSANLIGNQRTHGLCPECRQRYFPARNSSRDSVNQHTIGAVSSPTKSECFACER
jgi:hypothetical protein